MENQENRFAKTSSKAIKSLVSRAVPGNTNTKGCENRAGVHFRHIRYSFKGQVLVLKKLC